MKTSWPKSINFWLKTAETEHELVLHIQVCGLRILNTHTRMHTHNQENDHTS